MKKFIKIFSITIVSLLAILIITVSIALWLVFTPERFTPIVRKQADKFITCKSEFGEVELTFFSTFPNFGIKVKQLALINPVDGAPCDTLVKVNELVGVVDGAAWWKRDELKLIGLELTGGSVNIFSDSLGNTNYAIVSTGTTSSTEPKSETILPNIDIRNISLNDISFHYNDISSKINTAITNLTAEISGTISDDDISGYIRVSRSGVSLEFDGEKYLQQASLKLDMPLKITPSRQLIEFRNASFTINDLATALGLDVGQLVAGRVHGVGGDVRGVGVAAAGHRDVQRLPRHARCGEHVTGFHGQALGPMSRGGVAEVDVLGDIRRRQCDDARGVGLAAVVDVPVRRRHGERAVRLGCYDGPQ